MVELVALGDYHTAVGFLLASPPETSARYYRDALCTLALAHAAASLPDKSDKAAAVPPDSGGTGGGSNSSSHPGDVDETKDPTGNQEIVKNAPSNAASLLWQAAKVVTANAASVGDLLLGVPLLCSSGLPAEAAAVLQEAGLWRYAATLAAQLPPPAAAAALDNWAGHVQQGEGSVWRAVGLLAGAGELGAAALMLREAGLPDAAASFAAAVHDAGMTGGGGQGLISLQTASTGPQRNMGSLTAEAAALSETIMADFQQYVVELLAAV